MEERSRASSNEFCWNHRMNISWIIEWLLFESSNEYCLNCFINVGENRMHIKANLSNFASSLSNVLNKSNIFEFYCQYTRHRILTHFGNRKSHGTKPPYLRARDILGQEKQNKNDHLKWFKFFVCLVSVRPSLREWLAAKRLLGSLMSHVSVMVALVSDAMWYTSYILTQK